MKCQICLIIVMVALAWSQPLDLGRGGVYDNPEANAYWERRFGRGFFANLASIQRGIDTKAQLNKAKLGQESAIETTVDLKLKNLQQVANDLQVMQAPPEVLAIHPSTLYFEDVNF